METTWVLCPRCGGKTRLKVTAETNIERLPLFCPRCRLEQTVDIKKKIVTKSR